jgi:hypothetical protein
LPGIKLITQLKSSSTSGPYTFMDGEGFPWSLLVPVQWQHPGETQRIEKVYPFFTNWRISEGSSDTNWYLRPMDPTNQAPGDPTLSTDTLEFDSTDITPQEAKIDITLGTDPNGDDPVALHWSVPPTYIKVEENTEGPESHNVTVDLSNAINVPEELNIYFWCEDAAGARSDFANLNIKLVEPTTKKYPRLIIDTYKPTGPFGFGVVDNAVYLYRAVYRTDTGDELAPELIEGSFYSNPIFGTYGRIDYDSSTDPFVSGTKLYIRVTGQSSGNVGAYAIRVVEYVATGDINAQYPPAEDWFFGDINNKDTPYDDPPGDDGTIDGTIEGVPLNPVTIHLNEKLNRYLLAGDVDWFVLILP